MEDESTESMGLRALEAAAELLVLHQLDLLAQVEAQVRAVHHTMRRIETLRAAGFRVGPELSHSQREETMRRLAHELASLDAHVSIQHTSCVEMQATVERMRQRLASMKHAVQPHSPVRPVDPLASGGSEAP